MSITVRYHEHWSTKNKRLFGSWRRVNFNLHRELFFILDTHKIKRACFCCLLKEVTYLERRSLFYGGEFPIHSGPLLEVNCPCASCVSLNPRARFPHTEQLFLYTKTTLTSLILLSGTLTATLSPNEFNWGGRGCCVAFLVY
jgi:hypothetical protein